MEVKRDDHSEERRKFPRLNASVAIEYSVLQKPQSTETAFTKNISAGGICIIVYEEIKPGSILSLRLNLVDEHDYIDSRGRVAWVSEFCFDYDNRKCWDIGVEFIGISDEERARLSKYIFMLLR